MALRKPKQSYRERAHEVIANILQATDREVLAPIESELKARFDLVQKSHADLCRYIRESLGDDGKLSELRSKLPEHVEESRQVRSAIEALGRMSESRLALTTVARNLAQPILNAEGREQAAIAGREANAKALKAAHPLRPGTPGHAVDLDKRLKQLEGVPS